MVFFSYLQGRPVIDANDKRIGTVKDMVFIDGDKYAEISHLIYSDLNSTRRKTSWRYVRDIEYENTPKEDIDIRLNIPEEKIELEAEKIKEFLVTHIQDKQVIDMNGIRIVRVNDTLLGKLENRFCIVAVDVGVSGLLRRLGVERLVRRFFKDMHDHIIPWEFVESLSEEISNLRIKVKGSKVSDMHPADIADIMEDLSHKERVLIFNALDSQKAAEALAEAHPDVQQSVFRNLKSKRISEILEKMPPADAADILGIMPGIRSEELHSLMTPNSAENIRKLLQYKRDLAGGIMHTDFITVLSSFTVGRAIEKVRQFAPKSRHLYYIYVCDEGGKLAGTLSLRDILVSAAEKNVAEAMSSDVISVQTETPKEEVYKIMNRYNIMVLPVVDAENRIVGVISADEIIELMIPESLKRQRLLVRRRHRRKRRKIETHDTAGSQMPGVTARDEAKN